MRYLIMHSLPAFMLLALSAMAAAGDWNTNDAGVVLDGFDVVAYRSADRAIKGTPDNRSSHDGALFEFSSAANKVLFDADPAKYAPKYNGYCAFAMGAKNAKVPANPDSFKLYNGELLVFFNDLHEGQKFNTKLPWNDNELALAAKAEANWKVLGK